MTSDTVNSRTADGDVSSGVLVHLSQALALDGDAPDLTDQLAWVTCVLPVPATHQATLAWARSGGNDTLEHALNAAAPP